MLSRQNSIFFFFSAMVTVGIFTYLFSTVSLAEVINLLRGISFRWVILFLLLSFSMSLFRTWRSQLVLNVSGYHPNSMALFLIILVRNFFSDLLPARLGTLIYIYLVQTRLGIAFGPAASSFAYSLIFDMISLSLLIVLAVAVQASTLISSTVVITVGVLLGVVSMAVLFFLPGILRYLAKVCFFIPLVSSNLKRRLNEALQDTGRNLVLAGKQGIFWRIFVLSLGVRCCKYLSLYVLLLALVLPLGFTIQSFPFPSVFLGLCSAELAASLPISGIAGFGAYEGAWALVFQLLGYSERIAVLTSISHHLITQVYGYSLGAFALLVLLLPVFKRRAMAEPVGNHIPGRLFWFKFAGVAVVIISVSLFLFSGQVGSGAAVSSDNLLSIPAEAGSVKQEYIKMIRGKIVYQRPSGIFLLNLQDKKSQKIVPYGTYPRWAPDGRHIVFVHDNAIMLVDQDGGNLRKITVAEKAKAVGFGPDGKSVIFSDGTRLKKVELATARVTILVENGEFREFDLSPDGKRLAATVRTLLGPKVIVFNMRTGEEQERTVANGCSASLSPDGRLITVNDRSHTKLHLYQWQNLQPAGYVSAPEGMKFDNQFWSNHPQWLVSTSEGAGSNIYLHHIPSNSSYRMTSTGDSDRADLFVTEYRP